MYLQSAALGNPAALFHLARIYRKQKPDLCIEYLREAAEGGDLAAQVTLGKEY